MKKKHFEFVVSPTSFHNGACLHTYKITRYVMPHPKGGHIVMGDDDRFHVVHTNCLPPDTKPEISPDY